MFNLKLDCMEKDIQRRNVIDVLRSMDVGAIEVFPIVQKPSVTNTIISVFDTTKIGNKIRIACEGLHCLILVFVMFI